MSIDREQVDTFFVSIIEEQLTKEYGKKRQSALPGLIWLLGYDYSIPPYLDHYEYRVRDGYKTMIGKPYQINGEALQEMLNIAKSKGLHVMVTTPSNYNSSTVLVILTQLPIGYKSMKQAQNEHKTGSK